MGAVLTPTLLGVAEAGQLPNASTFCGRCEAVCPVKIPLPRMMRYWREREFEAHLNPRTQRWGLALWAFMVRRPALYRFIAGTAARLLGGLGKARGRFRALPLAGGWTDKRDLPAPQGRSFMSLWAERHKGRA
jgi:L-lactate dehydrogenase complex protein LldF